VALEEEEDSMRTITSIIAAAAIGAAVLLVPARPAAAYCYLGSLCEPYGSLTYPTLPPLVDPPGYVGYGGICGGGLSGNPLGGC
jgi:hypothetical protein